MGHCATIGGIEVRVPDTEQYQIALGAELRRLREARAWTRRDVVEHVSMSISLRTLTSWEHGTRAISVARFVELCLALGERPHIVLERIDDALLQGDDAAISMDLVSVVGLVRPELWPLRQWAAARLDEGGTTITLPAAAVDRLAQLCGVPADRLRVELAHASGGDCSDVADIGRVAS